MAPRGVSICSSRLHPCAWRSASPIPFGISHIRTEIPASKNQRYSKARSSGSRLAFRSTRNEHDCLQPWLISPRLSCASWYIVPHRWFDTKKSCQHRKECLSSAGRKKWWGYPRLPHFWSVPPVPLYFPRSTQSKAPVRISRIPPSSCIPATQGLLSALLPACLPASLPAIRKSPGAFCRDPYRLPESRQTGRIPPFWAIYIRIPDSRAWHAATTPEPHTPSPLPS